ncbi:YdcF family protein [Paenibacillus apii]|uniref:YdcF family protein n=1 Tax=Paenibacillus apii TaxID=1850370 RepID=UPI001982161E|nr:YdcF family protein [Paenibacillus apii]
MQRHLGGSSPIRALTGRRKWRFGRIPLVTLVLLLAAGLIWSAYVLTLINRAETTYPMNKADAGIILGMAMWGDEPSPGLKERLDYGLKLYKQGVFSHFIVTGGLDKPGYSYTEGQGMRNYLIARGVPDSAVAVENEATSTYENLLYSSEIMQHKGWSTAVVITHTFHGRRALEIADELGYSNPELGLTDSRTMSMAKYKTREILAYTKWKLQQVL